jgi:transcriptional regulator with XRE-family HTH domain
VDTNNDPLFYVDVTTSPGRVARKVRRVLRDRDVSQHNAALAIGLSQQSMSGRICGRTPFSAEEVLALAEYLKVPVSVLMDEPGAREHTDVAPHPRAPLAQPIPA